MLRAWLKDAAADDKESGECAGINEPMDGRAALYSSAEGGHVENVRSLLQRGANIDQADTTDGSTPLKAASQSGHTRVVRTLINAGADLNQADTTHGRTPLWSSSTSGHIGATRALIAAGNKPHHGE